MSIATTAGIVALAAIYAWHIARRRSINHWGLSMAGVGLLGLAVCFGAIFRDNYVDSIVATTDPTVEAGLFPVDSGVSYLGSVGGALAIAALLAGIFVRRPQHRQVLFFVIGAAMLAKVIVVESARVAL